MQEQILRNNGIEIVDNGLNDIKKEIDKESLKNITGKIFNAFLVSNTQYVKDFDYKSTENVINTHTEDKNKNFSFIGKTALYTLFGITSAQGIAALQPEFLEPKSEVWDLLVTKGVPQETVDSAIMFFYNLKNTLSFSENDLDVLYDNFEVMNNISQGTLYNSFLWTGAIGLYATSKFFSYNEKTMFNEEKIAEYSDDLEFSESTATLSHLKNTSILRNNTLNFGGSSANVVGKTCFYAIQAVNFIAKQPKNILSQIGELMIKKEQNLFEKCITSVMCNLKFEGYGLMSLEPNSQLNEIVELRKNMIADTKHRQSSDSTIKEDTGVVIQNCYENALRRKVKTSFAQAIIDLKDNTQLIKEHNEEIEKIKTSKTIKTQQKMLMTKSIKNKIKKSENTINTASDIIKGVSKLHLQKSNQLNNHYETLSYLAFSFLEDLNGNTNSNSNIKLFQKDNNISYKENIGSLLSKIDDDSLDIINKKQDVKIADFLAMITEELNPHFKSNISKAEFIKKSTIEINNAVKVVNQQNQTQPNTDTFVNGMGRVINTTLNIQNLLTTELDAVKNKFNRMAESLNHDLSNQLIKNPMDFNELVKIEQQIIASSRIGKVHIDQNAGAQSSNINKSLSYS
jgi:hypothetical protein